MRDDGTSADDASLPNAEVVEDGGPDTDPGSSSHLDSSPKSDAGAEVYPITNVAFVIDAAASVQDDILANPCPHVYDHARRHEAPSTDGRTCGNDRTRVNDRRQTEPLGLGEASQFQARRAVPHGNVQVPDTAHVQLAQRIAVAEHLTARKRGALALGPIIDESHYRELALYPRCVRHDERVAGRSPNYERRRRVERNGLGRRRGLHVAQCR